MRAAARVFKENHFVRDQALKRYLVTARPLHSLYIRTVYTVTAMTESWTPKPDGADCSDPLQF